MLDHGLLYYLLDVPLPYVRVAPPEINTQPGESLSPSWDPGHGFGGDSGVNGDGVGGVGGGRGGEAAGISGDLGLGQTKILKRPLHGGFVLRQ
jgi:hypothetical protein